MVRPWHHRLSAIFTNLTAVFTLAAIGLLTAALLSPPGGPAILFATSPRPAAGAEELLTTLSSAERQVITDELKSLRNQLPPDDAALAPARTRLDGMIDRQTQDAAARSMPQPSDRPRNLLLLAAAITALIAAFSGLLAQLLGHTRPQKAQPTLSLEPLHAQMAAMSEQLLSCRLAVSTSSDRTVEALETAGIAGTRFEHAAMEAQHRLATSIDRIETMPLAADGTSEIAGAVLQIAETATRSSRQVERLERALPELVMALSRISIPSDAEQRLLVNQLQDMLPQLRAATEAASLHVGAVAALQTRLGSEMEALPAVAIRLESVEASLSETAARTSERLREAEAVVATAEAAITTAEAALTTAEAALMTAGTAMVTAEHQMAVPLASLHEAAAAIAIQIEALGAGVDDASGLLIRTGERLATATDSLARIARDELPGMVAETAEAVLAARAEGIDIVQRFDVALNVTAAQFTSHAELLCTQSDVLAQRVSAGEDLIERLDTAIQHIGSNASQARLDEVATRFETVAAQADGQVTAMAGATEGLSDIVAGLPGFLLEGQTFLDGLRLTCDAALVRLETIAAPLSTEASPADESPIATHLLARIAPADRATTALTAALRRLGSVETAVGRLQHDAEALAEQTMVDDLATMPQAVAQEAPVLLDGLHSMIARLQSVATSLALAADGPEDHASATSVPLRMRHG